MRSQYNTGTSAPELNAQDKWGWRGGKEGENQKPCHWLVPPTFIAAFFSLCTLVSGYLYKYKNNRKEKKNPSKTQTSSKPSQQTNKKKITPSLPTTWQRLQCCGSARFSGEGAWIQWLRTVQAVLSTLLLEMKNIAWLFSAAAAWYWAVSLAVLTQHRFSVKHRKSRLSEDPSSGPWVLGPGNTSHSKGGESQPDLPYIDFIGLLPPLGALLVNMVSSESHQTLLFRG